MTSAGFVRELVAKLPNSVISSPSCEASLMLLDFLSRTRHLISCQLHSLVVLEIWTIEFVCHGSTFVFSYALLIIGI